MANLTESSIYETGIYQLETGDPVQGGTSGVSNTQAKQLANRTKWLRDAVLGMGGGGQAVIVSSGDLDAYAAPGFYFVESAVANKPESSTGLLVVNGLTTTGYGSKNVSQTFHAMGSAKVWTRLVFNDVPTAWVQILSSADAVAPGMVLAYAKNTAPTGWLKANGAAVSRTTYAALFANIGTTFGVGDGSTTFNLPDLRGLMVRGWDDGRGVDVSRVFGSEQAQAVDLGSGPTIARNLALLYCIKF